MIRFLVLIALLADVRLAWDAVPDVGYNVYRSQVSGQFGQLPVNDQPLAVTTFLDSAVPPGTFFYMVRSVKDGALSPPSNEISVDLPNINQPPTVAIRNPMDGQVIFGKRFTISVVSTDDAGVVRIDLFINGVPAWNTTGPTLAYDWNTSPYKGKGPVTIRASARDADGAMTSAEIVVTVNK